MIYRIGDKVKFKVVHSIKNGIILEKSTLDYPYHVRSEDNNDYWINEDSIVVDEPKLKYKVSDRVIFKFRNNGSKRTGTIVYVMHGSKYPYDIRDDHDGGTYSANDNNILGYAEERIDYTAFYGGRRPGKSVEPKWDALPDEGLLYSKKDVEVMTDMYRRILNTGAYLPKIKKVIFNDPATIVFWEDGTKTVVKAQTSVTGQAFADGQHLMDLTKTDLFDPEKGLAMAIAKKALGNDGNYYNEFKKWLPKED